MDDCDVLTSLLLRRVPPSDDGNPPASGSLTRSYIPGRRGRTFATCNDAKNGDNLLASPESRLCISNAIASTIAPAGLAHLLRVNGLRHMCRSYRTRSPEWRGDKEQDGPLSSRHSGGRTGAVRDKDRPTLGLRRTTIERPGPWSRRLRMSPNHPDMECFRDVAKPA